jgi:hypothetical protein
MRYLSVLAATLLMLSVSPVLADPVGKYDVEGTNPGNGQSYSGTVSVTKTGQTYKVVWVIGGTSYIGTAIGNEEFMAISYKAGGNNTGLALYAPKDDDWVGVWTYSGGTEMGTEHWTRQ